MKINKNYEETKHFLNLMKGHMREHKVDTLSQERRNLFEGKEDDKDDFIAITNDVRFGNNVLQTQIDAFKSSVNPGAKFSTEDSNNPSTNPLVYLPKTGNLIFSGTIPNMGNLKFQFSLMDVTNAPYIWCEGMPLTDEVVTTINKIKGFYLNWKEQWLLREDLLQKLDKSK